MPSWTAFCRTPSAKLIFVFPASTKVFNLFGIESTLSMRLEAKSKNINALPKAVTSKGRSRPKNKAVFGTSLVRPQPAAPMLFKWEQKSNGAKNWDTEASMANPLTSKVVILGKGHLEPKRPPTKSILVLVPVNFKMWRLLNTEFTCKAPVTSVSLRSTSWIRGQVSRTATSPAILVLERCTQFSGWEPFNAPRFPVTLVFDRSRNWMILASAKAARSPVTAVLRRKRYSILVQLAKTAKSPEIFVSLKSSSFKSLSSLKLWLKVPLRSLRPLRLMYKTMHSDLYLDRCPTALFQVQAPQKKRLLSNATLATLAHDLHLLWNSLVFQRKGFVVEGGLNFIYLMHIQNQKWITKVYVYVYALCTYVWSIPLVILSFQNCQGTTRHLPPFLCL